MTREIETPELEDESHEADDEQPRMTEAPSAIVGMAKNGSLALLAGGVAFARAMRSRSRSSAGWLAGMALIGVGLYQRRSTGEASATEDDSKDVSDEAHAAVMRQDTGRQSETSPSGEVSDEPVMADEEESDVAFTDEQGTESGPKPELDEDVDDPRRATSEDDTEVDLSEAALAEEPSEATGPDPEQAQPAQTEDTEPEHSPPEDASHMEADASSEEATDEGDDSQTDDTGTDVSESETDEEAEPSEDGENEAQS